MGKLIALVVAVIVIVWLLKRAIAGPRRPAAGSKADPAAGATPQGDLVTCAHCGVNLPKSEARAAGGAPAGAVGPYFCSEEHLRAGPRKP